MGGKGKGFMKYVSLLPIHKLARLFMMEIGVEWSWYIIIKKDC